MRIDTNLGFTVHVAGRGEVRLIDIMRELGVDGHGVPSRVYHRNNYTVVTCRFGSGQPYWELTLDLGANRLDLDGFKPSVVARERISYVMTFALLLFEYEPGKLFGFSMRRKARQTAFTPFQGELLFEVVGEPAGTDVRVRLPHRPGQEWTLVGGGGLWSWLDRRPTELEIRLRELQLGTLRDDYRNPLFASDWLLDYAFKERLTLTYDGGRINWMAIERWDDERQHEDLSVDEAIIALKHSVLTEDRCDWGVLSDDQVRQYLAANWGSAAYGDQLQEMTHLWLIERRMIRAAMQAVKQARQLA